MNQVERRQLLLGARNAVAVPAWMVGFSMLGVGSLARDAGHPLGAALLSTILVWAGPAQAILYAGLLTGSALPAIAIAVALSGIRLTPMTIAVMPYLRRPGQGRLSQFLVAHLVVMTSWVEAMRRLPSLPPEARLPYYLGFSGTCLLVSLGATAVGYLLVDALPPFLAAALLCLTPIYFGVALSSSVKATADLASVVLGAALAPAAAWAFGKNFDVLIAGVLGGSLAYGLAKLRARRRP